MNNYLVGFNNDGILIEEPITANDKDEAKVKAQPLHPDLSIIFVKWLKQECKWMIQYRTRHQYCYCCTKRADWSASSGQSNVDG
jgi:hypothetical protein